LASLAAARALPLLAAAGEGAILAGPVGTTPPMVSGGDWTPAGMELVSRENDVH